MYVFGYLNIWLQGYKIFSMLNSAEHKIFSADKHENAQVFMKTPTIVSGSAMFGSTLDREVLGFSPAGGRILDCMAFHCIEHFIIILP